jgi:hypothetical protein
LSRLKFQKHLNSFETTFQTENFNVKEICFASNLIPNSHRFINFSLKREKEENSYRNFSI